MLFGKFGVASCTPFYKQTTNQNPIKHCVNLDGYSLAHVVMYGNCGRYSYRSNKLKHLLKPDSNNGPGNMSHCTDTVLNFLEP